MEPRLLTRVCRGCDNAPYVISQFMVAIPMVIFFEISMVVVRVLGVKKRNSIDAA
ncbi:Twin-arginine translocation protein TatC [Methanosarcina sp. MTP4]|uniref:hypothetical protein n=1 Tax=Methanosarcina sp. MTP4 TaxID=1434100 RepID=UPI0006161DD5|nr:hypothetical protein [Methanosarcina sp. MTP4]AKB25461.1 Twin-arginine translocation protein TatC [Methanosarcina sp. MTP4]